MDWSENISQCTVLKSSTALWMYEFEEFIIVCCFCQDKMSIWRTFDRQQSRHVLEVGLGDYWIWISDPRSIITFARWCKKFLTGCDLTRGKAASWDFRAMTRCWHHLFFYKSSGGFQLSFCCFRQIILGTVTIWALCRENDSIWLTARTINIYIFVKPNVAIEKLTGV